VNSTRRTGLLLVLVFIVSLPAVTPRIYAADEVEYFSFLRSLWFDHDLSFDNEYRHFYDAIGRRMPGFRETFLEDTTPTGRRRNFGTIGCALLWAPFYGLADVAVHVMPAAGQPIQPDGFSRPYVAAVCYGSAAYALAALLLSASAARRVLGKGTPNIRRWAAVSAVLALAGTPLLFYVYVAPVFAHACSAFAVALFVVTWLVVRRRWSARGLIALGAAAALMAMVREQDAFFVVGPAIDLVLALVGSMRARRPNDAPDDDVPPPVSRLLANACAGCIAFAIVWLPQAIAYLDLNGRLGPSGLVSRKMAWNSPHALQVLASPEHGLLFWTPLVVVGLIGLALVAIERGSPAGTRRVVACMLAMVAAQVYVAGSVQSWTVAGAFGQRRFVGLTVLLVIGLAAILGRQRSRASRVVTATLLAVCTWWNLALMVQFGTGLMDRQRLTLGTNLYNAFVVVPREIPRIVYRYMFDRTSFYATPRR